MLKKVFCPVTDAVTSTGGRISSAASEKIASVGAAASAAMSEKLAIVQGIKVFPTYDLPVYLVHTGYDENKYEILFDWETYLSQSKGSLISRPAFNIRSGRVGIDRKVFADRFRRQFEEEYALFLRREDEKVPEKRETVIPHIGMGFDFWVDSSMFVLLTGGAGLVPLFTLWLGLGSANAVISEVNGLISKVSNLSPFKKDRKTKIDVDAKKAEIDAALQRIEIKLQADLMVNAYGPNGLLSDSDAKATYDALASEWSLPDFVRSRLDYSAQDFPR